MRIAVSAGPVTNTQLENRELSFEQFCAWLVSSPVGDKGGPYFVRGACAEGNFTRSDESITNASMIIIDADSSIDLKTGEVSPGAPAPELAHQALLHLNYQHLLYTTHSHGGEKGNRYRIALPCEISMPSELHACVDYLLSALHLMGIYIAPTRENLAWSQPWFLPRVSSADSEYLFFKHLTGKTLDVGACVDHFEKHQIKEAEQHRSHHDPHSPISRFNSRNGNLEFMLEILDNQGYQRAGESQHNGAIHYRLLAPSSTSGSPGVVLFRSEDGQYRGISFHGEEDPLSHTDPRTGKRRSFSAFDLYRIFEHDRDRAAAVHAWLEENDDRPVIRIAADRLGQNLRATINALGQVDPPVIYQREQQLVRIIHLDEITEIQGCKVPTGSVIISEIDKPLLQVRLQETIKWEKYSQSQHDWGPADPCAKVTAALLESAGEWGDIPRLQGISETPVFTPEGRLISTRGYDSATRLYIEAHVPQLAVPEHPTKDEAQRAVQVLLEPFQEFPFVDAALDQSVLLAYIFTLALRLQLPLAPLFGFSATTPGTGKGLMVELANLMVRGRDAAIMPPVTGYSADEETRKRITALLLQGIPSINLDNWTETIGGSAMNTLLTATEWTDRILTTSKTVRLPSRVTWSATGNNLSVADDMTRRSLLVRLDAHDEHPELREFKNPDVRQYVLQNRNRFLSAIFTILKAYAIAPDKQHVKQLGRFEEWSQRVCGPLTWLGLPDPLLSQEQLREIDPVTEELQEVLERIYDFKGDSHFTAGDLIKEPLTPGAADRSNAEQEQRLLLQEALMAVAGDNHCINTRRLGKYFTRHTGRILGGYVLRQVPQSPKTKSSKHYYVERLPV